MSLQSHRHLLFSAYSYFYMGNRDGFCMRKGWRWHAQKTHPWRLFHWHPHEIISQILLSKINVIQLAISQEQSCILNTVTKGCVTGTLLLVGHGNSIHGDTVAAFCISKTLFKLNSSMIYFPYERLLMVKWPPLVWDMPGECSHARRMPSCQENAFTDTIVNPWTQNT